MPFSGTIYIEMRKKRKQLFNKVIGKVIVSDIERGRRKKKRLGINV